MSLAERGWSTQEVSLAGLLRGDTVTAGPTRRGVPEAVDAGDGRWLAVEVKLGGSKQIEQAARSLLSVKRKVDEARMGDATKLLVVTASGGYSYERPDGVSVAPISALGP